jgi:hypothetical protein
MTHRAVLILDVTKSPATHHDTAPAGVVIAVITITINPVVVGLCSVLITAIPTSALF